MTRHPRTFLLAVFTAAMLLGWRTIAANQRSSLRPYALAMHVHALSHHGNPWAGSMAAHSWYAAHTGTDVVWWTDHHEIFQPADFDFEIDFSGAQVDPKTHDVELAPEPGLDEGAAASNRPIASPDRKTKPVYGFVTRLFAQAGGGTPEVKIDGSSLVMGCSAAPSRNLQSFSLTPRGPVYPHVGYWPGKQYERMVRSFFLSRPLTTGLRLRLDVEPGEMSADVRQSIVFDLTYHHKERDFRQRLTYALASERTPAGRHADGAESVMVTVPVKSGLNRLDLDLLADAGLLEEGRDNTILEMFFRVEAKNGKRASMKIGRWGLVSTVNSVQQNYDALAGFTKEYATKYKVQQFLGVEWTQNPHLNGFFPRASAPQFTQLIRSAWGNKAPAEFISSIHGVGGLASLNHAFGASHAGLSPPAERLRRGTEMTKVLLANKAHGADLLEVGYTHRGGADLNDHLRLWDILTANGLVLTGTGVSDTHQVPWTEFSPPESFVTWVWANDNSDRTLIDALRKRRAYFGNPFRFHGTLDAVLRSGASEARMGETIAAGEKQGLLQIEMNQKREDDYVFLVHVKTKPGLDLEYKTYQRRINPYQAVPIDLSEPGFVRIEVYDHNRLPLVFTNPIYITRPS